MQYKTEIVVIGGGPAGICAAISAAREGKETVLITDRPVLGGNSSSEIRVWTRGATGAGNLFAEEMGIWGELKLRNLYVNPEGNPVFWDDVLLDAVLSHKNIKLFLNTHITDVNCSENKVMSVAGFQMASEKKLEFCGDMFIDATGDGTIGALAGVPYHMGKESREEYQETLATPYEESTTFGNTIFYFTVRGEDVVEYKAPEYAYNIEEIESFLDKGGRIVNEEMNGCDYWWFETGGMKDTIADAQEIAMDLKRLVAGVWNYIKNSGKFDASNLTLSWQGNVPGKRESRRMITDTVVKQQDVLGQTQLENTQPEAPQFGQPHFRDVGFYGGWYLDFHPSDGIHTEEDFCIQIPVQIYPMPMSALYNRKVPNLLFAGRNIGTSHVAFASSRIMNTCALSGQTAGTLAAWCVSGGRYPHEIEENECAQIQQLLIKNDMLLLGVESADTGNLAAQAQVEVSSVETSGTETSGIEASVQEANMLEASMLEASMLEASMLEANMLLEKDSFLIVPSEAGEVQVLLEIGEKSVLCYDCYAFDVPSKLAHKEKKKEVELLLHPGRQWITLPLPKVKEPQFFVLMITKANDIRIKTGSRQLTGFLGGCKAHAGLWYPCIRFSNPSLYEGEKVKNGYNRPYKSPNIWISKEEEAPYMVLSWKKEVEIHQISLMFNPDLSLELGSSRASSWNAHHMFEPRTAMPPQLVKDFDILAWKDGKWNLLKTVKDNWRRSVTVSLEKPYTSSKIKVQINSTYGAKQGEIFEVRVY